MLLISFSGHISNSRCLQNTRVVRRLSWPLWRKKRVWRQSGAVVIPHNFFCLLHSLIWVFVYVTVPVTAHVSSEMSSGKAEAVLGSKEQVHQVIGLLLGSPWCAFLFLFFNYSSSRTCGYSWLWVSGSEHWSNMAVNSEHRNSVCCPFFQNGWKVTLNNWHLLSSELLLVPCSCIPVGIGGRDSQFFF